MDEVLTRPVPVEPSFDLRLPRLGSVNAVCLEERAAALAARALDEAARLHALLLAVQLLELTALGERETPGSVRELCGQAIRPVPSDRSVPPVAAMCVTPALVQLCRDCVKKAGVSVATFVEPLGARRAVDAGADEIEIPFDAGAFLAGRYALLVDEITTVRKVIDGTALLTVVVDPADLGGYDELRRASLLATLAGADFIGLSPASLPSTLCVLETLRDVYDDAGRIVGLKSARICLADDALHHLILVRESLGAAALTSGRYRLAGPGLLDDLVQEIAAADADKPPY